MSSALGSRARAAHLVTGPRQPGDSCLLLQVSKTKSIEVLYQDSRSISSEFWRLPSQTCPWAVPRLRSGSRPWTAGLSARPTSRAHARRTAPARLLCPDKGDLSQPGALKPRCRTVSWLWLQCTDKAWPPGRAQKLSIRGLQSIYLCHPGPLPDPTAASCP